MSQNAEPQMSSTEWEGMSQSELRQYAKDHLGDEDKDIFDRFVWLAKLRAVCLHIGLFLSGLLSRLAFKAIHWSAQRAGQPLVDLGQKYSADQMNERISQLEVLMLNQWTNLNEDDFLTANKEMQQFIAACHVARQYDRITAQLLAKRLGITAAKADQLVVELMKEEVITEPYPETYYDVRRSAIDEVINRHVADLRRIAPGDVPTGKESTKAACSLSWRRLYLLYIFQDYLRAGLEADMLGLIADLAVATDERGSERENLSRV